MRHKKKKKNLNYGSNNSNCSAKYSDNSSIIGEATTALRTREEEIATVRVEVRSKKNNSSDYTSNRSNYSYSYNCGKRRSPRLESIYIYIERERWDRRRILLLITVIIVWVNPNPASYPCAFL